MSHTTTVKDIIITDIHALKSAVSHLKKNGVNCDLLEGAIPRAYSSTQEGMNEKAPFVLKLHNRNYDVGFYETKVNGVSGYEARTDFYTGAVKGELGVPKEKGVSEAQTNLGKLYQAYAVCSTKNRAIEQGYTVQESVDASGTIQLRLSA